MSTLSHRVFRSAYQRVRDGAQVHSESAVAGDPQEARSAGIYFRLCFRGQEHSSGHASYALRDESGWTVVRLALRCRSSAARPLHTQDQIGPVQEASASPTK